MLLRSAQRRFTAGVFVAGLALSSSPLWGGDERHDELLQEHREWLEIVAPLITDEERSYFLSLPESYQRGAFIAEFWRVRDPDERTPLNELRLDWQERAETVRREIGDFEDARAHALLFAGPPGGWILPDGREVDRCYHTRDEIEVWFYGRRGERRSFVLVFQQRLGKSLYELYRSGDRLAARGRKRLPTRNALELCRDLLGYALRILGEDPFYDPFVEELFTPPQPPTEWVASFAARGTLLHPGATPLPATLSFEFLGRKQSRTAVQGVVLLKGDEVGTVDTPLDYLLTGEVIRDGKLFERFRYRYELAPEDRGLPLVFQRYLRPGEARMVVKVEELAGQRFARLDRELEIPPGGEVLPTLSAAESAFLERFEEANLAFGEVAAIRILPLETERSVHVGQVRFATVATGEIDRVTFLLNGHPVLTKRRPPYSVELNLGQMAATHLLRVEAYDREGEVVASDELEVNQGGQRFRVRIVEPRSQRRYRRSVLAVAQLQLPEEAELDRLELFLNERRVATLYQPPFEQAIALGDDGLAYLRAVAYLTDGNSTEDVVFINAPDLVEEVEVQYVELYASAVDKRGQPLLGLERQHFSVSEDGVTQEIRRFDWVETLPVHAALLLDTSASMEESLEGVQAAARSFAEEILLPKDRIAVLAFNSRPSVELGFSGSVPEVTRALDRLKAEGGTALYDSLVFALSYFHGVRGQRALLLLSDGKDEASRFDFETTLEIARRAGVTIYVIGLREAADERGGRKILRQLALETGGRAFFIDHLDELEGIYTSIQEELRSQYLLTYQSTSDQDPSVFRRVEVRLEGVAGEVLTMSGYYP